MHSISRFHEFLNELPRGAFNKAVKRYDADRYCKSFDSWGHLVAMVYAQLSKSTSLRDIAIGFNTQSHHHFHLGATQVTRSTLADANKRRDWRVFESPRFSRRLQPLRRLSHEEVEQVLP